MVMHAGQCVGMVTGSREFSLGSSIFFSKVGREMISREQERRQWDSKYEKNGYCRNGRES